MFTFWATAIGTHVDHIRIVELFPLIETAVTSGRGERKESLLLRNHLKFAFVNGYSMPQQLFAAPHFECPIVQLVQRRAHGAPAADTITIMQRFYGCIGYFVYEILLV